MNQLHQARASITRVSLFAWLVMGMVVWMLPAATHAQDAVQAPTHKPARVIDLGNEKLILGRDNEIYGTQEAYDLVMEARKYDPMFAAEANRDRDKAIALYEQAIAAQPGAKLNGPIVNRIAQMYAFYSDRDKNVKPDFAKATGFWKRCLEYTSPDQLLWSQTQMGLASAGYITGDPNWALKCYSNILSVDKNLIALDDSKYWPKGDNERDKTELEREWARLSENIDGIKNKAAEKTYLILSRVSKDAALASLQSVSNDFKGTPTGDHVSKIIDSIRAQGPTDPWALPASLLDPIVPEQSVAMETMPQIRIQGQLATQALPMDSPQVQAVIEQLQLETAEPPSRNLWGIAAGVLALMVTALVVFAIVIARRKNQA